MSYHYEPSPFMLPTSHYDKAKADRAVTFINNLSHTKGKWAGNRFDLLPWQEQIVRDLFGIVKEDGNRQFLTAYIEIPKRMASPNSPQLLHFIYSMQIMKPVQKFMVRLVTETKRQSYLMWPNRWYR